MNLWDYRQCNWWPRDAGTIALTEGSPSQSWLEPFEVGEIQKFLNLPERNPPDLGEEALLQSFIQAAREFAEIAQGRDLVRKQWDLTVRNGGPFALRAPLSSVDLVQRRNVDGSTTELTEGTDYRVDKGRGVLWIDEADLWGAAESWEPELLIRFTSGYLPDSIFWKDAGARIKVGMKLLISAWYFNRLPFGEDASPAEFPYAVTSCLSHGAIPRLI